MTGCGAEVFLRAGGPAAVPLRACCAAALLERPARIEPASPVRRAAEPHGEPALPLRGPAGPQGEPALPVRGLAGPQAEPVSFVCRAVGPTAHAAEVAAGPAEGAR
jgi:hypothetical protein